MARLRGLEPPLILVRSEMPIQFDYSRTTLVLRKGIEPLLKLCRSLKPTPRTHGAYLSVRGVLITPLKPIATVTHFNLVGCLRIELSCLVLQASALTTIAYTPCNLASDTGVEPIMAVLQHPISPLWESEINWYQVKDSIPPSPVRVVTGFYLKLTRYKLVGDEGIEPIVNR